MDVRFWIQVVAVALGVVGCFVDGVSFRLDSAVAIVAAVEVSRAFRVRGDAPKSPERIDGGDGGDGGEPSQTTIRFPFG